MTQGKRKKKKYASTRYILIFNLSLKDKNEFIITGNHGFNLIISTSSRSSLSNYISHDISLPPKAVLNSSRIPAVVQPPFLNKNTPLYQNSILFIEQSLIISLTTPIISLYDISLPSPAVLIQILNPVVVQPPSTQKLDHPSISNPKIHPSLPVCPFPKSDSILNIPNIKLSSTTQYQNQITIGYSAWSPCSEPRYFKTIYKNQKVSKIPPNPNRRRKNSNVLSFLQILHSCISAEYQTSSKPDYPFSNPNLTILPKMTTPTDSNTSSYADVAMTTPSIELPLHFKDDQYTKVLDALNALNLDALDLENESDKQRTMETINQLIPHDAAPTVKDVFFTQIHIGPELIPVKPQQLGRLISQSNKNSEWTNILPYCSFSKNEKFYLKITTRTRAQLQNLAGKTIKLGPNSYVIPKDHQYRPHYYVYVKEELIRPVIIDFAWFCFSRKIPFLHAVYPKAIEGTHVGHTLFYFATHHMPPNFENKNGSIMREFTAQSTRTRYILYHKDNQVNAANIPPSILARKNQRNRRHQQQSNQNNINQSNKRQKNSLLAALQRKPSTIHQQNPPTRQRPTTIPENAATDYPLPNSTENEQQIPEHIPNLNSNWDTRSVISHYSVATTMLTDGDINAVDPISKLLIWRTARPAYAPDDFVLEVELSDNLLQPNSTNGYTSNYPTAKQKILHQTEVDHRLTNLTKSIHPTMAVEYQNLLNHHQPLRVILRSSRAKRIMIYWNAIYRIMYTRGPLYQDQECNLSYPYQLNYYVYENQLHEMQPDELFKFLTKMEEVPCEKATAYEKQILTLSAFDLFLRAYAPQVYEPDSLLCQKLGIHYYYLQGNPCFLSDYTLIELAQSNLFHGSQWDHQFSATWKKFYRVTRSLSLIDVFLPTRMYHQLTSTIYLRNNEKRTHTQPVEDTPDSILEWGNMGQK